MDPRRFDTLVRTLSTGGSRRRLLGVLSALPLVGTALTAEDTTAAKTKRKARKRGQDTGTEASSCARRCRKKSSKQARRRCRKRCQTPPECTTSQDCPAGELCEDGRCIPIPDQCSVNADCDACEACQDGVCVAQCQPDEVCRNNQCESVQCATDRDCGDCARCVEGRCRWQCTVTEVCLSGAGGRCCQPRGCPAGTNCGTADDGCGGQARCGPETCAGQGEICGGDGTPNVCGCTPTTCTAVGAQCGLIADGCGGPLDCGSCPPPPTLCQRARCTGNRCTYPPANDGVACDDGDACTIGSTCVNGTCGNGTSICTDPPVCRTTVGATCSGGTCTYPLAAAGTTCDAVPCGTCDGTGSCTGCQNGGTCSGGVCQCTNSCPTNFVRQADCRCQCPTEKGYVLINDACFRQYPSASACRDECPCLSCSTIGTCLGSNKGPCGAGGECPAGSGCIQGVTCYTPCTV